jgi:hypothetical protein
VGLLNNVVDMATVLATGGQFTSVPPASLAASSCRSKCVRSMVQRF